MPVYNKLFSLQTLCKLLRSASLLSASSIIFSLFPFLEDIWASLYCIGGVMSTGYFQNLQIIYIPIFLLLLNLGLESLYISLSMTGSWWFSKIACFSTGVPGSALPCRTPFLSWSLPDSQCIPGFKDMHNGVGRPFTCCWLPRLALLSMKIVLCKDKFRS